MKSALALHCSQVKDVYHVNADHTYEGTFSQTCTIDAIEDIEEVQRQEIEYFPDTEQFTLVKAYVIEPNGHTVHVNASQIFTRDTNEDTHAPGFIKSKTTTVVLPQLQPESRYVVEYKINYHKYLNKM